MSSRVTQTLRYDVIIESSYVTSYIVHHILHHIVFCTSHILCGDYPIYNNVDTHLPAKTEIQKGHRQTSQILI